MLQVHAADFKNPNGGMVPFVITYEGTNQTKTSDSVFFSFDSARFGLFAQC